MILILCTYNKMKRVTLQNKTSIISICRTPYTLEMRCRLIPPCGSNIVYPSIPSKTRWCTRFGQNMMKYDFYVTTYQSGGEGQGDTQTDVGTDRQTNLIGEIGRPTGIETPHPIRLGFSRRISQSEFWWEKLPLNLNQFFTPTFVFNF